MQPLSRLFLRASIRSFWRLTQGMTAAKFANGNHLPRSCLLVFWAGCRKEAARSFTAGRSGREPVFSSDPALVPSPSFRLSANLPNGGGVFGNPRRTRRRDAERKERGCRGTGLFPSNPRRTRRRDAERKERGCRGTGLFPSNPRRTRRRDAERKERGCRGTGLFPSNPHRARRRDASGLKRGTHTNASESSNPGAGLSVRNRKNRSISACRSVCEVRLLPEVFFTGRSCLGGVPVCLKVFRWLRIDSRGVVPHLLRRIRLIDRTASMGLLAYTSQPSSAMCGVKPSLESSPTLPAIAGKERRSASRVLSDSPCRFSVVSFSATQTMRDLSGLETRLRLIPRNWAVLPAWAVPFDTRKRRRPSAVSEVPTRRVRWFASGFIRRLLVQRLCQALAAPSVFASPGNPVQRLLRPAAATPVRRVVAILRQVLGCKPPLLGSPALRAARLSQ